MPVFLSPTLRQHQTLLLLNWMKNDVYKTINFPWIIRFLNLLAAWVNKTLMIPAKWFHSTIEWNTLHCLISCHNSFLRGKSNESLSGQLHRDDFFFPLILFKILFIMGTFRIGRCGGTFLFNLKQRASAKILIVPLFRIKLLEQKFWAF